MLKGYADHHVVVAIVQALCTRGMDVMTAVNRGQQEADDAELLADALANQRVMLTNDTDFLALAAERARRGEVFAPIFFWPQQQRGIGEIMRKIIREATLHSSMRRARECSSYRRQATEEGFRSFSSIGICRRTFLCGMANKRFATLLLPGLMQSPPETCRSA